MPPSESFIQSKKSNTDVEGPSTSKVASASKNPDLHLIAGTEIQKEPIINTTEILKNAKRTFQLECVQRDLNLDDIDKDLSWMSSNAPSAELINGSLKINIALKLDGQEKSKKPNTNGMYTKKIEF